MSAGCARGTLNVPGIVGFRRGVRNCGPGNAERSCPDALAARQAAGGGCFERLDEVYLNGHPTERLPGNLNVSFALPSRANRC